MIAAIAMFGLLAAYDLDKRYDKISEELKERKNQSETKAA
jgi:hypothetical protein